MIQGVKMVWWFKATPQYANKGWLLRQQKVDLDNRKYTMVKIGPYPACQRGQWVDLADVEWRVATPNEI